MTTQMIYNFSKEGSDGGAHLKHLLGGKGANLAEMSRVGLNIPPGFTITTEVCSIYNKNNRTFPPELWPMVEDSLKIVEDKTKMKFGDPSNPLLVSVRSGAAVSMPGMMDTVLNLGMNDEVVEGMSKRMDPRFVWDCYRRLIDMFGNVVLGMEHKGFEEVLSKVKKDKGAANDVDLKAEDLKLVVEGFKQVYRDNGLEFPTDPKKQLSLAINAVFNSWDGPNAKKYREINKITNLLGTAVNVQSMVFGNWSDDSGTGVLFTRNPSTGEDKLYGEYLINAQGEDVVAGIRTPLNLDVMQTEIPAIHKQIFDTVKMLERHYKDMMDVEFTIQSGILYMLQCRAGKRTGAAAVKIAVDMVREGLVTKEQAVNMVEPGHLDQLLHPQFKDMKADSYKNAVIAHGLAASPGAAVGQIVFGSEEAEAMAKQGVKCIMVRQETSPDDVSGMHASEGILTCKGGMTSHAAVVARGWGKPCVCGCAELHIDETANTLTIDGKKFSTGDWISLNGATGEVLTGKHQVEPPKIAGDMAVLMEWVDAARTMEVFTNADTPEDALEARHNGAQGIGLVRTEHMFFSCEERLENMRYMILSDCKQERAKALEKLIKYQRDDFEGIFTAMDGCTVTIRMLDPPLHEFLPKMDQVEACQNLAKDLSIPLSDVQERIRNHHEVNPMLGLRGCRLGITSPDITEMQARAIMEAAVNVKAKGITAIPNIMVPLVGTRKELENQTAIIYRVIEEVQAKSGVKIDHLVGTMIETPRAALVAGDIANAADFFSFGTNDLTQMTFGYSRDDAGTFLPSYVSDGILPCDPFEVLDATGVGKLIQMAVEAGRATKPNLKIGICGEHGGEAQSIKFISQFGFNYVSCSPFRVPIARLACAQAEIAKKKK